MSSTFLWLSSRPVWKLFLRRFWLAVVLGSSAFAGRAGDVIGLFDGQSDIGELKRPGIAQYDSSTHRYQVSASGSNMWFRRDDFHFVWKKMSGDIALAADISFVGSSPEPHRKALLIIRESLAADSRYADVATHGDGLTSLQFRADEGGTTKEVQANLSHPTRLRIEKKGDTVYMSLATAGASLAPSGCSVQFPVTDEYYIGIGVCAHQADGFETVTFSNVQFSPPSHEVTTMRSSLETIDIASTDRRSIYHTEEHIEAPNWSRLGDALIFNGGGLIYRLSLAPGSKPERIDTGFAVKCNNDHGLSPDGSQLAISDDTKDGRSRIYILPTAGGPPRQVTSEIPSYWHGWSPDGATLAYCASRDGKFGIFTIPLAGGKETRLTTAEGPDGLDDGPDYSADGKWIYFNSDRSGQMQIWRMHPDGGNLEQVTSDEFNNWFAHPSPNGKWLVFLSYAPGVKGHPPDHDVTLRLMPIGGGPITVLTKLFGGQGTINVPSWSPDSKRVAYMRYQPAAPKAP
jgi:TolB protein